ncbi:hypothetical protein A45J_0594 [hot springs metagenome]|uniref:HEPN domain-containing protein n=1 Tax=hot springs metagenome TaxID=433727 RepID=A0A5J4KZC2_9ZZZZ
MKERLMQARESMEEAKLLHKEKVGNKLVLAKLYHAMIYCLFALFRIKEIGHLTHADIIERFEKEYVMPGFFDASILKVLRHVYDLTHECDCEHMPVPADDDIRLTMQTAEEFITQTENCFKKM